MKSGFRLLVTGQLRALQIQVDQCGLWRVFRFPIEVKSPVDSIRIDRGGFQNLFAKSTVRPTPGRLGVGGSRSDQNTQRDPESGTRKNYRIGGRCIRFCRCIRSCFSACRSMNDRPATSINAENARASKALAIWEMSTAVSELSRPITLA